MQSIQAGTGDVQQAGRQAVARYLCLTTACTVAWPPAFASVACSMHMHVTGAAHAHVYIDVGGGRRRSVHSSYPRAPGIWTSGAP